MTFDGATVLPEDVPRLASQLSMVYRVMRDGQWKSLEQIAQACWWRWSEKVSEASVSARLRDLRKPRFGGHTVQRRRVVGGNGLHQYQLIRRSSHVA